MALWDRGRQGMPVQPGQLLHHSDAGSQNAALRCTEHLELEGIALSALSRNPYDSGREPVTLQCPGKREQVTP